MIPSSNSPQDSEIIGGLKNAIERGESIEKANQSLINAGYNQADVKRASQQLSGAYSAVSKNPVYVQKSEEKIPKPLTPKSEPKKASKTLIIALVILTILILAGATITGLYWDKIFS